MLVHLLLVKNINAFGFVTSSYLMVEKCRAPWMPKMYLQSPISMIFELGKVKKDVDQTCKSLYLKHKMNFKPEALLLGSI